MTASETKYSRIPIYRDDVDHIVGVVFSKDLLDLIPLPPSPIEVDSNSSYTKNRGLWSQVTAMDLMEDTYYIPETVRCYLWTLCPHICRE